MVNAVDGAMNRIVALWCHPRSMSTSVERVMRERGDLTCLHEPFMYHYYLNQKHREMPFFEPRADHPVPYSEVRDMILQKAKASAVFFKDMGYYVESDIFNDTEFSQRVTHCFLIRNPKAAIASYFNLDKAVTLPEIGIEAQWKLYTHLAESGIKPIVLQAELIRKNPKAMVGAWWKTIGLENKDAAFEWDDSAPTDWNQVKGWHQNSIESRAIQPWSREHARDEAIRFEAAANEAPHLQSYLEHHQLFYERLKEVSLQFT